MIKFTPEQQKVIDLHNRNILVSAAAGSGKTAVLVERIIQMISNETNPVDIDRLLIVTFTNAAAAEMRERISLGISRQLMEYPESEHLQKQATLLHNAQITTIDSFCLFILRNHFNEIGLDPAFRVADEGEIKLLQQDALSELLEERFGEKDEKFFYCVEYFCPSGKERILEQYILNLYQYAESYPWPEDWLEARKEDYGVELEKPLEETGYGIYLNHHIQHMLEGIFASYQYLQQLCQEPDGPHMYGELVDQEMEQIEKLCSFTSLEELASRLPNLSWGRLSSAKDSSVSPMKREQAKKLRTQIKESVQGMAERFFATPLPLALEQMKECGEPVEQLLELVIEFRRRMQEKKRDKKVLDFADMEHLALNILLKKEDGKMVPSQVAKEYRQHFHEILVDEYQDSNLVQEYLLNVISGEEDGHFNRFMVGDVKQSIYKFRLARPELFLEKYETYTQEDSVCQRIDLSRNFRSRDVVVDTVNAVFSLIMNKEMGGIAYDDKAALYTGATYPDNGEILSELLLIEKPEKDQELNAKQAEAMTIAHKIKELRQEFQVTDKESGQLRQVNFRDIVILLRTTSGWDEEFKKILETQGIPVYITSKTGYFGATEVQELLQVLRVLDNPMQDIPLFGVMKSVFGGFSDEEIAQIRSKDKKISLYEVLKTMEENDKVTALLEKINRYRRYTTYMPIRELLQHIVEEHDYVQYVSALPSGSKRKANVEMLFTKASDFEKTSYFGLFHFVRYIEQLEKYDVDYGEAELMDENADVVRIMSIHKSKGLEFPITFLSGLSKRFNMQDANQSFIIDVDLGVGTDYVNPTKRIRNKTLRRNVLARKMKEDNLAEELRVLYVAMTRPKEKMILTATMDKAAEKWELYSERKSRKLLFNEYMEASSYMDFIFPTIKDAPIKVQVIDTSAIMGTETREQVQLFEKKELLKYASSKADEEELESLRGRFTYQYPFQALENLYTKTTVSELKILAMEEKDEVAFHTFEEKEVVPYIPAFRRETEEVTGTTRGNAFHKVMELLEFGKIYEGIFDSLPENIDEFQNGLGNGLSLRLHQNIEAFLAKQELEKTLSSEYRQAVSIQKLIVFLTDAIAYRMWVAEHKNQLYKEQPFVYGVSANRLGEQFPEEEKVLIQGIIDVFFVENDSIVLLDYKTDVIASKEELWNRYEVQVRYYEEALHKLMDMPIKEKVLYSFYLGECVVGN